MKDIELVKQNSNHLIVDGPSGDVLVTIHTSLWTCTEIEKESICNKILEVFKYDTNNLCEVKNNFDFCNNCGFCSKGE